MDGGSIPPGSTIWAAEILDSIKTAANARDVPYQSLIKVWLQEKLQSS
jgi:predicted DNA binding CopG/RHH family protein